MLELGFSLYNSLYNGSTRRIAIPIRDKAYRLTVNTLWLPLYRAMKHFLGHELKYCLEREELGNSLLGTVIATKCTNLRTFRSFPPGLEKRDKRRVIRGVWVSIDNQIIRAFSNRLARWIRE